MTLFEWDSAKARSNRRKHGVDFAEAIHVFEDPFALSELEDDEGSGEIRWKTLGAVQNLLLLLVVHTVREQGKDEVIRIISTRRADRKEKKFYDENREKNTR